MPNATIKRYQTGRVFSDLSRTDTVRGSIGREATGRVTATLRIREEGA